MEEQIDRIGELGRKLKEAADTKMDWMGTMSGLQLYALLLKQMQKEIVSVIGEPLVSPLNYGPEED